MKIKVYSLLIVGFNALKALSIAVSVLPVTHINLEVHFIGANTALPVHSDALPSFGAAGTNQTTFNNESMIRALSGFLCFHSSMLNNH